MKAEIAQVGLKPRGIFGKPAMALTKSLPPKWRAKAAKLFWKLGFLEQV
jgi:hypothetical protein